MTWKQFTDEVKVLLTVDATRQGAAAFVDAQIIQAVIDLQRLVPIFQKDHEVEYKATDFVEAGLGSKARLPVGAQITSAVFVRMHPDCTCVQYPCTDFAWENRSDLIYNGIHLSDRNARITIDPHGNTFYIYPQVKAEEDIGGVIYVNKVLITWSGIQTAFEGGECVKFTTKEAGIVADWVKSKVAKHITHESNDAATFLGDYVVGRRHLYLDMKDQLRPK